MSPTRHENDRLEARSQELLRLICINAETTIRTALKAIDDGSASLALVIDERRHLLGTVTDGDVRRAILRGLSLEGPIHPVMNRTPTVARPGESPERMLQIMLSHRLRQIPLVDADGVLVGVRLLDDLVSPEGRENWAVVMAGGLGERLRPYTQAVPKPMLMVGNQPILERALRQLKLHGFERVFVSVNFLGEKIEGYFQDGGAFGLRLSYLRENTRLGTAGALSLLPERPRQPMVVMNADLLTEVSFSSLLDFHADEGAAMTVCVSTYELQVPYGVVNVDGARVSAIQEKPKHTWFINAGIYVLNPECLDLIPRGQPYDMPTLIDRLIKDGGKVASFPIRESWLDIGQLHDYQHAVLRAVHGDKEP
ncbi:MAG: nucleotidyltransferase family protein [Myxococcota bacterium]